MTLVTRAALPFFAAIALAVLAWATTPSPSPIPEEIEIAGLSDWFGPVVLPHAAHAEILGDCVSCHHHSDGEPTPCATCHESTPVTAEDGPPTLRVAYHRQCVGCHAEAGAPTTCEGCHPRKRLPRGPALGPAAR